MNKDKLDLKNLLEKANVVLKQARRYSFVLFITFVVLIYAFVLLRINGLSNAQPSSDAISSNVRSAHVPRIDKSVVQQLQSLQDNSVSVKSLFNQARNNPFQE